MSSRGFDRVLGFGRIIVSALKGDSKAILADVAEFDDDEGIFSFLAADVLGSPLDKLVVLAIVTSALGYGQQRIRAYTMPGTRTSCVYRARPVTLTGPSTRNPPEAVLSTSEESQRAPLIRRARIRDPWLSLPVRQRAPRSGPPAPRLQAGDWRQRI